MSAIDWLEAHDKLAGWAQFVGAILALSLTYLTAFAPQWRRKKQMKNAARRLLAHGYEVLESYHRTSANFLPVSLTLRGAAVSMTTVLDEMNRFPIYELDDHGSRSLARHLVAISGALSGTRLMLESMANDIEGRTASAEERDLIVEFLGERLKLVTDMLSGAELKRPIWPISLDSPN